MLKGGTKVRKNTRGVFLVESPHNTPIVRAPWEVRRDFSSSRKEAAVGLECRLIVLLNGDSRAEGNKKYIIIMLGTICLT